MALPIPQPNLSQSGSRRWIPERSTSKTISTKRPTPIQFEDTSLPSPTQNPTEALIHHLLNPSVEEAEANEYDSYIDQFSHLSLSQDDNLSAKDALLYQMQVEVGEATLKVDAGSENMYKDVVSRAYA